MTAICKLTLSQLLLNLLYAKSNEQFIDKKTRQNIIHISSKNSAVFFVHLAVYKDVLFLLHGRVPDAIRLD